MLRAAALIFRVVQTTTNWLSTRNPDVSHCGLASPDQGLWHFARLALGSRFASAVAHLDPVFARKQFSCPRDACAGPRADASLDRPAHRAKFVGGALRRRHTTQCPFPSFGASRWGSPELSCRPTGSFHVRSRLQMSQTAPVRLPVFGTTRSRPRIHLRPRAAWQRLQRAVMPSSRCWRELT